MEDLLHRNFGLKPQGKSVPMAASRSTVFGSGISSRPSPLNTGESGWNSTGSFLDHQNDFFGPSNNPNNQNRQDSGVYDDVFGGPPNFTKPSESRGPSYDDFFESFKDQGKSSSLPVYDKPVYDEDILEGIPGLKSNSSVKYEDVFTSISSSTPPNSAAIDDFLGHFGRTDSDSKGQSGRRSGEASKEDSGFDELIPGFGVTNHPKNRESMETNHPHQPTVPSAKSASNILEDPFVVLEPSPVPSSGFFTDPLEPVSIPTSTGSGSTKDDGPSVAGTVFNDIDAFDGFSKSVPSFSSEANTNKKDKSPLTTGQHASQPPPTANKEPNNDKIASKSSENNTTKKDYVNNYTESHKTVFDMPRGSSGYRKAAGRTDVNSSSYEPNSQVNSPTSDDNLETADDAWLTVDEVPLCTQPTSAPPPSRPPPPLVIKQSSILKPDRSSNAVFDAKRRVSDFSSFSEPSQHHQFPRTTTTDYGKTSRTSIDELEDFAMGNSQAYTDDHADVLLSEEDTETNSAALASAAAMEAMERAGAKMRQAREARERVRDAKVVKSREPGWQDRDEKTVQEAQEQEYREKQERLDREREQREREEKERERKRIEKEREERDKGRIAVERATREARERAAAEARQKAERAAVERANGEARQRAERSAVERATTEARERAAAEARERADKVAAEARERERAGKFAVEARERAANEARERAAVDRAAADARARAERAAVERAYAEARLRAAERAAAAAKDTQQKNDNDLESFFGMGARPSSVPRQRATTPDSVFENQFQNRTGSEGIRRTSVGTSTGTSSSMRKASSTTNIVDDLSSIFGAGPSSGEFQEIEGESEERRKARLERHMRTAERTAKALAEKKERDIQTQRDQAERHRIAETVDAEIKRWAAGKEGNLRALLSTLQYVLWPECGWQPVSLTDLITAASVKKVYRKATLCIHPDKVQQKGANIQQKYIAEKVFDLLKEAWNKFNSEELF